MEKTEAFMGSVIVLSLTTLALFGITNGTKCQLDQQKQKTEQVQIQADLERHKIGLDEKVREWLMNLELKGE